MERDNFEISQELEQMREQFRILREKVAKQNIVYEKQLRSSMRKKMNSYDFWETWMQIIFLIPLGYLLYVLTIQRVGMPAWTTVMLCAYCAVCITILLIKKMMQDRLLDYKGDLKMFALNIRKVKKWHLRSILIATPISLIFMALFFTEYIKARNQIISTEALIAAIVVMIVGMAIDVYVDTRKSKILDNIIKDIEE